jgi:hypothetical protein
MGNLVFKAVGVLLAAPFVGLWLRYVRPLPGRPATVVVLFHLAFNVLMALIFIGLTQVVGALGEHWLPKPDKPWWPAARTTWIPRRWPRPRWPSPAPRARRCTRPTWSRPCCWACCA